MQNLLPRKFSVTDMYGKSANQNVSVFRTEGIRHPKSLLPQINQSLPKKGDNTLKSLCENFALQH